MTPNPRTAEPGTMFYEPLRMRLGPQTRAQARNWAVVPARDAVVRVARERARREKMRMLERSKDQADRIRDELKVLVAQNMEES